MSLSLSQTAEHIETLDLRELADIDLEQNLHLGLEPEETVHLTVDTGFGSATIFLTYEGFFTIIVKNAAMTEELVLVEDVLFSHFPPHLVQPRGGW